MSRSGPWARIAKVAGVAMIVVALGFAGWYLDAQQTLAELLLWIASLGALAPMVFIGLHYRVHSVRPRVNHDDWSRGAVWCDSWGRFTSPSARPSVPPAPRLAIENR
jgi:hypothetical protein